MSDNLHKFLLYLSGKGEYWRINDIEKVLNNDLFLYPISFEDRISKGHYIHFDDKNLPLFHSRTGNLVPFCTGLCSFAFANWDKFKRTEEIEYANKLLDAADKLIELAEKNELVWMIYDYDDLEKSNPLTCAMNQGEAISVMVRAYKHSNNSKYKDAAISLSKAFQTEYGKYGVIKKIDSERIWFLEGGKRILNGHIYCIFGLYDLYRIYPENWIRELLDQGVNTVKSTLDQFDTGYWSKYWLEHPVYIASAMYHNLHFCQLLALYQIFNEPLFLEYHNRFKSYNKSFLYRVFAASQLVLSKLKLKFLNN